jgi:hypothetical protein
MKSRISTNLDNQTHAELELLVAYRKYLKKIEGSQKPASIGDVITEAIELLIKQEREQGWNPNANS